MSDVRALYLDLLKKTLTDWVHVGPIRDLGERPSRSLRDWMRNQVIATLRKRGFVLMRYSPHDIAERRGWREEGRDHPSQADTMIGLKRMNNLQHCVESVLRDGIPGDLIETGVWRGGATIFMRAILRAYGVTDRRVWVADSFEGLPPPSPDKYPADAGSIHHLSQELRVTVEDVKNNFRKYGLLDDQVQFLKGWFHETLPTAPIERLAVLRLDGDMYESTISAITPLYDRLSPGGYVIVDDYGAVPGCKQAIDDYRKQRGITDPIEVIDWGGVYWRKAK